MVAAGTTPCFDDSLNFRDGTRERCARGATRSLRVQFVFSAFRLRSYVPPLGTVSGCACERREKNQTNEEEARSFPEHSPIPEHISLRVPQARGAAGNKRPREWGSSRSRQEGTTTRSILQKTPSCPSASFLSLPFPCVFFVLSPVSENLESRAGGDHLEGVGGSRQASQSNERSASHLS